MTNNSRGEGEIEAKIQGRGTGFRTKLSLPWPGTKRQPLTTFDFLPKMQK